MATTGTKGNTSHTDGLLRGIVASTTDSDTLNRVVSWLTSVKPTERTREDFDVLHDALSNPNIRKDTLETARAKEERHIITERDIMALGLIETRLGAMLRGDRNLKTVRVNVKKL